MKKEDVIKHEGIVQATYDGKSMVKIVSLSACAACHAKGACSMADMAEKEIEVVNDPDMNLKPGQHVNVVMKSSLGVKAVLLGYVYPLIVVVAVLFTLLHVTGNEGLSALLSLASLIPYYLILSNRKKKLRREFGFHVEPFTD